MCDLIKDLAVQRKGPQLFDLMQFLIKSRHVIFCKPIFTKDWLKGGHGIKTLKKSKKIQKKIVRIQKYSA